MKVIALSMLVAGAAAADLKLHTSTSTHLHAEYKGLAAEVRHLDKETGISRIYDSETGENLLQVKNIDGDVKVQLLDHPPMEFEHGGDIPKEYHDYFVEFEEHPKMELIGELSRELGSSEAQKKVAHWVHFLAVNRGKRMEQEAKNELVQLTASEGEEEVGMWGGGRRRRRRRHYYQMPLTNKCGNSCFGRCGPGCTKWSWVCGNDDSYTGCWEHDCYCSCNGMGSARCLGLMAFSSTCNYPLCAKFQCDETPSASCTLNDSGLNPHGFSHPAGSWREA